MPATFLTQLPDAQAPTLGNGVEDEIAVSIPDTTNNGVYRLQIRETGQDTWDSTATGFAEKTVASDSDTSGTVDTIFASREDGEEYEVRIRSETEHATGAWTSPVSIVTKFPEPGFDTLQPGDKSTLYAGWTDTSNNEDGVRVYYRQVGASSWTEFEDLSPNTTETVIDTLQGGTEYEVKVEYYTEHTSTESQILTERANYYYERGISISGSGAIQANRSGKNSARSTRIFGSGSLSLSREIKMARAAALNGSGGIEVTRDVAKNRNLKISGTGSISTEAQFKETFPSELTNGLTWEYNQDRMGFESEWVQFEASDGHGTASFYFTGTLGKVDPISPTVIMDYDSNGNGEVDERSTPKKVKFPDEPVTFPLISGDDGYYRVLLKDLRPEDIISLVKFGPAHT